MDIDNKIDDIFKNICERPSLKMDLDFLMYYKRNRRFFDLMTKPPFELIEITPDKIIRFTKIGRQVKKEGGWLIYLNNEERNEIEDKAINKRISELTIENLELQNKQLKNKILYAIIGGAIGFILANWKDILVMIQAIDKSSIQ